ncbi:Rapid alkalinization factor [Hibiscus syriacus]|uniref:Rapid alkalinization factor n=1 Tax=Hibiscus syriacus TaxID=106335 RepID=A0A6A2WM87_HIBSY|nr:Rapid alkalinization factor [Hibiscus syriacus]
MNTRLACALLIFFPALSVVSSSSNASMNQGQTMYPDVVHYRGGGATKPCDRLSGECDEYIDEWDSEMTRRWLAGKRYISYRSLMQNAVPCNERGRSYYNCGASGRVNPYTRGCSIITLCARITD